MHTLLTPHALVFDIGAHQGIKTDQYLKKGAHVICFEPQPQLATALRRKYSGDSRVVVVECALGEQEEKKPMFICSSATAISTLSNQWKTGRFSRETWDKTIKVTVSTLDQMIQKYGLPEFCKIDVEGYELNVLKGLSHPIKYLSFEFTQEFFANTKLCIEHLVSLGYTKFNYAIAEKEQFACPQWKHARDLIQVIENSFDTTIEPNSLTGLWGDIYAYYEPCI